LENILVSVITPSYNAEKFIEHTIRSVQAQTHKNWEMLIVDDCSSDSTVEIINRIASEDPRVKLTRLETNSGAAVARNTAIEKAEGKYIAFLDSDDFWKPEKLQTQLEFMEKGNYVFTYTNYEIVKEDGTATGQEVRVPPSLTYHDLLKNTIIGCLTVMINIDAIGKYKMPNIRTRQDFALWLSILKDGYTAYGLQESLSCYRKVEGSISSNKYKAAKKTWAVYRNIENLSLPYSAWCFVNYAYNAVKKSR
jgi:teichuronic acid biosynthesis glycosyltransferase TuaG